MKISLIDNTIGRVEIRSKIDTLKTTMQNNHRSHNPQELNICDIR